MADAKTIVKEAANPLDGMADLRWALFNSNEFRFINDNAVASLPDGYRMLSTRLYT